MTGSRGGEQPAVWQLRAEVDAWAPDGAEVRLLGQSSIGSQAHFRLPPGAVTRAVVHLTVTEFWYVVGGSGDIWLAPEGKPGTEHSLSAGAAVVIPVGTRFQFRATADSDLQIVAVTVPPWPTERDEAVPTADHWTPTV